MPRFQSTKKIKLSTVDSTKRVKARIRNTSQTSSSSSKFNRKMHFTYPILLATLFFASLAISLSDPRVSQAALLCSNRTADLPHRQTFVKNFLSVMNAVTPQIASRKFASASAGTSKEDYIFAFGECMRDLSHDDCDLCFATCKTTIVRCLPFQKATRGGRNFLDGCYLRYDDHDFSGEFLSEEDRVSCGNESAVNRADFAKIAAEIISILSSAADNDGFIVGSKETGSSGVYGLAQCWENVNKSSCRLCLEAAAKDLRSCVPMVEGRALYSGCYLRYSNKKFFNNSTKINADKESGGGKTAVVLAVVFSTLAALTIVSLSAIFVGRKWARRRRVKKLMGSMAVAVDKSNLNFKYEVLEKATNYFNISNKLGQGGSGSVFKGVLPDGRIVAVKRLIFNTRQWVDQFFREVNLISKVNHKNLVQLLGCSITGPESLLVYEYVHNKSLLHHLSDPVKACHLDWSTRCRIILGLAEGLTHLHEGGEVKIIHRDIKLSNILLDEQWNVKIADFGLARLLPEGKTHLSTALAGTLGYMAPEYLVRGKLTEKVDVYSFGIVVMETVCGRSKTTRKATPDPLSLLQNVWKLYTLERLGEAVDSCLEGVFDAEETFRVLRVGLLCAQASAELRPPMSAVVRMLRKEEDIPPPEQPPFLRLSANGNSDARALSCSDQSSANSTSMSEVIPR